MGADNSRMFDDLTRVAGGAVTVISAIGKQLQAGLKDQVEGRFSNGSPANDDVERLMGVVTKLRLEQEDLKKRVAELEAMIGVKPAKKAATAKPEKATTKTKAKAKPAAKRKTAKRT